MKKTIALLLAIMMLCTVLVGCGDNKTQNDNNDSPTKGYVLRLGTDAVGGTANTALEAMSAIVNQKTDMKTSTVVTTGAVEIINLINSGELEGGYAGTINLIQALNGEAPFTSAIPMESMCQAFGFVSWMLPIITTADKGITSYEELEGKTVAFPQQGSASAEVMKILALLRADRQGQHRVLWLERCMGGAEGRSCGCRMRQLVQRDSRFRHH